MVLTKSGAVVLLIILEHLIKWSIKGRGACGCQTIAGKGTATDNSICACSGDNWYGEIHTSGIMRQKSPTISIR